MAPKKTTEKAKKPEGEVKVRKRVIKKVEPEAKEAPVVETTIIEPRSIIVETVPATPAVPHEPEVKAIEEKAVTIWDRIKAWKWFWPAIILLLLLSIGLVYNLFRTKVIEKGIEKTEKKEVEVKTKVAQSDNTIKHSDSLKSEERLLLDSLKDALQKVNESTQKWQDYEKKKYQ